MVDKPAELETVITYLEMTSPPSAPPPPPPLGQLALMRAEKLTVAFYRFLYNTVGADHMWWERRMISDAELAAAVLADNVDVFVLYAGGVPAGYFELSETENGKVIELAYFGLMPEFIGQGYGAYLLRMAIDEAWSRGPHRLFVHTCNLDHPNALQVYQRAGFEVYDQKKKLIPDPRELGLFD
ncbi:GNAT family N-acetyltransferase [Thalassospiraceae bacterium LMO-JJ14]|nr:GNAT family N-acetyltransferase [Thalassospiraceae bacterium LMO-JJ14]